MNEPVDRKFRFNASRVKDPSSPIITEYSAVVFKCADNAFLPTLEFYLQECHRVGASKKQKDGVHLLIERVKRWREEHKDQCKIPDIDEGVESSVVLAPNEK